MRINKHNLTGQTLVEYALVLSFISIIAIIAITVLICLGNNVKSSGRTDGDIPLNSHHYRIIVGNEYFDCNILPTLNPDGTYTIHPAAENDVIVHGDWHAEEIK